MMVLKEPLTPETFLSAPRRGVIAPNRNGTLGLYNVSTHEFGVGTKKEWRIMNLKTGNSVQLTNDEDARDAIWDPLSDDVVMWLKTTKEGNAEMTFAYLAGEEGRVDRTSCEVVAGGPVQGLKVRAIDERRMAIAVVGLADGKGGVYNPDDSKNKPASTARIYDDINVREWDAYIKPQKYTIFYTAIYKFQDGTRKLTSPLRNALHKDDTGLEAPAEMYGGRDSPTDRFDFHEYGIVFTARDPNPDPTKPQYSTASDLYFVEITDWAAEGPPDTKPVKIVPQRGTGHDAPGVVSNPRCSPDGSMVAFLKMGFENEAAVRLMMVPVHSGPPVFDVFDVWERVIRGEQWDLVPEGFEYAPHGSSVFITAQNCGRVSLFELELHRGARPEMISDHGTVKGSYAFKDGDGRTKVLVSGSSLVESSYYGLYDTTAKSEPVILSTATTYGKKLGLSPSQVSDIWFEGSEESCEQAWMTKPSNFDDKKKWPLILMIHGGPESAWQDEWHWRWNAALWAEQGYIVVQPNITGSTGFGVAFTSGIYNQWGGRPYQDLVNCMEHLAQIPYIDMDRAAMAGGSYGGYMVNWILGQPLAKKFKAAICHDSVFDMTNSYLYSDFISGVNDMGGPGLPWLNAENMDKWNPARPDLLKNWKDGPPTLFIHSDKDYRCPITDGLAAFKALRCQGVPARFLTFPDENHFVLKPENALVWNKTVFEWLERWVGTGLQDVMGTGAGEGGVVSGDRVAPEVGNLIEWWH